GEEASESTRELLSVQRRPSGAEWSWLTGYGATHTGYGETSQDVRTWDLILRRRLIRKPTGRGTYSGSHDFLIEGAISHLLKPADRAPIFAVNFLASWSLTRWKRVRPYLFIGGGPVYTEAGIDEMGAHVNGNYQAGLGLAWKRQGQTLGVIEYRFHHISNGGRKEPNDPLNSSKVLLGLRLAF
ncbi:MAG: acyloxyacyl hydrolase, partial [Kiritimatiellia bacterium]|nr:acyloxyacyl hydrolase [Kiritimatiellia bacterium]